MDTVQSGKGRDELQEWDLPLCWLWSLFPLMFSSLHVQQVLRSAGSLEQQEVQPAWLLVTAPEPAAALPEGPGPA